MKKGLLLLTVGVLFSLLLSAQKGTKMFNEDFSGSVPPTGWTIDNISGQWSQSSSANAGGTAPEAKLTYISGTNTTRLISPETDLTGISTVLFSFKHFLDDYSGTGYSVGVATRSGGGNWTDIWTVSPTGDIEPETNDILISNADVGASDFQICIYLSGNTFNFDYWYIDDLVLIIPDNNDSEMASVDISPYAAAGNIDIDCTIKNLGLNNITSLDVNYQIDAGTIITENLSGLTLAITESLNHTFTTPWDATAGNYNLNIWVSNMNGAGDDDDTSNDLQSLTMSIATQSVTNMPLYEEFTSSTCAPCATFNSGTFTPFMNSHPDDITVIKYQMSWPSPGDPYYTEEGGTRRGYYGVSFVPDLVAGGVKTATTSTGVNDAYTYETSKPAFFDLSATHQITGNTISVQVNVMPYITANGFSVQMVVLERITTENVGNNGETEFKNVMMKMLPDANGTLIDFNSDVSSFLSESFDMATTNVEDINDLLVVVFVQNNKTKEVFQSTYSIEAALPSPEVSFSPTNGATEVNVETDIKISFNQSMRFADNSEITNVNISNFINLTDPSNADIPYTATINDSKSVITLIPNTFLPELTEITVGINDLEIEGINDVALSGSIAVFTTASFPVSNVMFNPADGSTGVNFNTDIVLTFDNAMRKVDDSEITDGDISSFVTLTDPLKGNITYTATINTEKTFITLSPNQILPETTNVTVTVLDNVVENQFGNALSLSAATFTTSAYPVPNVTFNPGDGSAGTNINTDITLTFDAAMRKIDDSEISDGDISSFITLTDPSKGAIAYTGTINTEKNVITIDPTEDFSVSTNITVSIAGDIIENQFDNILAAATATFTTSETNQISALLNNINIYPNPTKNVVFISNAQNSTVRITDLYGKALFETVIISDTHKINTNNLPTGLYIINFEIDGFKTSKKLIIVK